MFVGILGFLLIWGVLIDWIWYLGVWRRGGDMLDGLFAVGCYVVCWRGCISGYLTNMVELLRALLLAIARPSWPTSYGRVISQ